MSDFRRPVSPVEWWFAAHPRRAAPVVQLVVEGDGEIGHAELAAAVALASRACPGARLVRRKRVWVDGGETPPVRTVDAWEGEPGPITRLRALHRPLTDTETCEVLLVPGSPVRVVFRASHAAMDGHGVLAWAADVFRVLRGEQPVGAPSAVTESDVMDRLGVTRTETRPALEWPSPLGQPPCTRNRRTLWRRLTVDGYHPALVAKVATALTSIFGLETGRYAIAVDLRRHVPGERSTANLSQSTLFDVRADRPWTEPHERLLRALAERRELSGRVDPALLAMPIALLRPLIALLDRRSAARDRYAATATLSHLGRIEQADFSTLTFAATTAYSLSTLPTAGPPEITMVECGGRTELTLVWADGPGMARRLDGVLAALGESLSPAAAREWEGNRTAEPGPRCTVVRAFRRRARAVPDAVALRWPGGELTYAELDRRSDVVAAELHARGAGLGDVVGLLGGRAAETIVGLWGVLKAGAAYLPLDVRHPDSRIASLLESARARHCLVQEAHSGRACTPEGCAMLVLERMPYGTRPALPPPEPRLDDLAYVIFTSGSTGAPKGVEIEHRALANYAAWAGRRFRVDRSTCFALFTSLAFDLPNTAIYLPLLAGGTLALVPDEPSHRSLRHLVEETGANALKLTPSHLDLILRLGLRPEGFRLLVVGGEQLTGPLAARARETFGPGCRIFNHYGPTEATVGCLVHRYDPERDAGAAVVPVGRPVANMAAYLLDESRRHVTPGETGELYLSGAQLARGYRGRPDLDRERFVTLADGTRAYRTGDLARLLPDGELAFLGRADDQVKVLGHRIEPAEVARVIETHPAVARAVVVAREGGARGGKRLYGYAQPVAGARLDTAGLTAYLRERLPAYMTPSAIVAVAEIPQTANGKLDVRALPDPFAGDAQAAGAAGAARRAGVRDGTRDGARDAVVASVAKVWARVLGLDPDALDDDADFNRLGGDSVLLVEMLAGVCHDVVGADAEPAFMDRLGEIVARPTLDQVASLARRVLADRAPAAPAG